MKLATEVKQDGPSGTKYLGVGVAWAGSVGLFLFFGSLLDRRMDTKPVFTVVGAAIGIVAGFISLIRQVKQDAKTSTSTRSDDGPSDT